MKEVIRLPPRQFFAEATRGANVQPPHMDQVCLRIAYQFHTQSMRLLENKKVQERVVYMVYCLFFYIANSTDISTWMTEVARMGRNSNGSSLSPSTAPSQSPSPQVRSNRASDARLKEWYFPFRQPLSSSSPFSQVEDLSFDEQQDFKRFTSDFRCWRSHGVRYIFLTRHLSLGSLVYLHEPVKAPRDCTLGNEDSSGFMVDLNPDDDDDNG